MVKKVAIFDFDFRCSNSYDEIADEVIRFDGTNSSKNPFLITPNVDDVVNWNKPEYAILKEEFKKSAFVLADGQPLVLFSKLIGKNLIRRMPGSSLFPFIWSRIKEKGYPVLLILARNEICEWYEKDYELCKTYFPPVFDSKDTTQIKNIVFACKESIEKFNPYFVFIGIQFPKQNILALELFRSISVKRMPLFLMLGASMEFYSGHLKRSPRFFQQIGLEWFYRFCQHPNRLFKRYFINDMQIFKIFIKEFIKSKN